MFSKKYKINTALKELPIKFITNQMFGFTKPETNLFFLAQSETGQKSQVGFG